MKSKPLTALLTAATLMVAAETADAGPKQGILRDIYDYTAHGYNTAKETVFGIPEPKKPKSKTPIRRPAPSEFAKLVRRVAREHDGIPGFNKGVAHCVVYGGNEMILQDADVVSIEDPITETKYTVAVADSYYRNGVEVKSMMYVVTADNVAGNVTTTMALEDQFADGRGPRYGKITTVDTTDPANPVENVTDMDLKEIVSADVRCREGVFEPFLEKTIGDRYKTAETDETARAASVKSGIKAIGIPTLETH